MQDKSSVVGSGLFMAALVCGVSLCSPDLRAQNQVNGSSCAPAPAGLVGWWQAEGNANDAAGGNNGSITGTVRFVPGEVGLGFEFDGVTSAVTVPASSNLTVKSLTVEAWIFPYDVTSPRPIVEFAAPTGLASVHFWYGLTSASGGASGAPGALYGLLRDPGGAALQLGTASGLIVSNRWTHVALTFDSTARTASLYIDGSIVASNTSPVAIAPSTSLPVNLGYRPPGSSELLAGARHLGGLDEVSIYNRALSATEIQSIYNADDAGKCPPGGPTNCFATPTNLVSWWRAEGDASDNIGVNNGIIGGGVTFVGGEVGLAFNFDGVHGGVTVPASASLNVGAGSGFSLEAWINPSGTVADPIFDWCPNGAWGVHFYANELNGGYLYADVVDTSQNHHTIQSATAILVTNRFQHVALTYDKASGIARLFVNGAIVAESNLGAFTPQTGADLQIGHRLPGAPYGEYAFAGLIDEASLYSRALSAVEIQGIYQAGSAGKCTTPTAPTIVSQPASLTIGAGGTAVFTVTATGTSPLSYQWRFSGGDLTGQTGSSLVLSNVQLVNGGAYSVRVSNSSGSVLSSNALLTVLPASPNCVPAPAGMVGWWRAEGDANDAVGGNNGVIAGNVTFVQGEVGEAFHYDGATSAVTVPASSNLAVRSFTVEAWISPEDISHPRPILEYAGTGPGYIHFWYGLTASPAGGVASPGTLYGLVRDPGGASLQVSSAAGLISSNHWSHVAFTFDYSARTAVLYLNGVNVASNVSSVVIQPLTSLPVNLGFSPPQSTDLLAGTRHLGKLDEASIYNRALSGAELQSIYNAGSAGKCPSPPSTNCVSAPAGLISWWPAEGDSRDIAGTNSGMLVNGVTFAPGEVGQAFSFNGIDQVVRVPDAPSLNPTNGLTLEGWVYAQAFSANDSTSLAGKDDASFNRQYLLGMAQVSSNWVFRAHVGLPGGFTLVNGTIPLQTQTWCHVAMTYDGASLRLYVNGTLDTSLAATGAIVTTSVPLLIGGSVPGPWDFNGKIDELSLYGRALSISEIQGIYAAGGAGKCRGALPPLITSQPTSQTVSVGGSANFRVGATGTAPLSYQWVFNGTNVVGQTGTSLVLSNVQPANGGTYSVLVSNMVGSVLSSNALLTVLLPTNNCVPAPAGLVGWWRGEGNANDSANGNDGVITGNVTFLTGEVGEAFNFDGATSAVTVPASSNLAVQTFTIEAWIWPTDVSSPRPIVEYAGPTGLSSVAFWLGSGTAVASPGALYAVLRDTTNGALECKTATGLISSNQWSHVAVTFNASNQSLFLYVNGVNVGSNSSPVSIQPQTFVPVNLGHRPTGSGEIWPGRTLAGLLDEVSIYNRALSGAEILSIYNAGNAGKCPSGLAPRITTQPADQTALVGGTATFNVKATGAAPLAYQWRFNGTNLPAQTSAWLTLSNIQMSNAGVYAALVTNQVGSVLSSNALLTVIPPPTNCVPAPSGLVGWWPGEGNADDAAGGNNGIVGGSVTFGPGEVGQAFSFDGVTSAVTVPASSTLTVHSLTIEAWVAPYDISHPRPIVEYAGPTGPGYVQLWYGITAAPGGAVGAPGALYGLLRDPGGAALQVGSSAGLLPSNQWSHVALTFDYTARIARLFVNGVNVASNGSPVAVQPLTSVPVNLGYRPPQSSELLAGARHVGKLDEVSIYNRVLSAGEIQSIYQAGSAGKCPVSPPPGCVPPGAGTVSWWRAEGNAQDAVGPNNGTLMNGTGFASGKVGLAFAFNGVNQFVQVPDAPSLNPTNSLTMEMWVNVSAYSSNDGVAIVGKDNPYAVRQYLLSLGNVSGQWVFRPHVGVPGGLRYFNGTMPIQLNTWYHVAMTYDGLSLKLFVNGIPDGSLTVSGPIVTSAEPLLIGGSVPGPWYFNGSVDELTLYNRALSQAEIQAIYQAGSAGKCTGSVRPDLANISAGTVQNQALSLPTQNLLALAAPSGVPLALSSVSSTSTNGGTVSMQTNSVVYTPPANFVGADRFTYSASGAQSGPASAYVLVQVRPANQITGQALPATAIPAGFQLKVTGTPGSAYTVERAASVNGPWTVLNAVTVGPDGLGSITDTNPPASAAFYRIVGQ